MNHRKKFGVFISHIYGDYQIRLCRGIIEKASEYGYLIEIFASNDGENLGEYGKGEFSLINVPRPDDYAGIIIASGTYLMPSFEQSLLRMLQEHFTCPVIDVSQKPSIYPRIILDNNAPIKDMVLHLGRKHHYKRICYLGSSKNADNNILRERFFTEGMKELSLPVTNSIFSCGYARESIEQALDQMLAADTLPEAIICYNDNIALSVIAILTDLGYHVPEQIAVTGCDTLEFGQMTSPRLTSVTFPIEEIGKAAVEKLISAGRGEKVPAATTITASLCLGNSCGCKDSKPNFSYFHARKLDGHIATLEQNLVLNIRMSAILQNVENIDRGMDLIAQFAVNLPDCREFYLCLYEDWDKVSSHIREITLTKEDEHNSDTILLKLALKDGKRLPACTFTKRNILPDYLYDDQSSSYVYAPLFFGDKNFGYLALSFTNDKIGYPFFFLLWLMNVNSMLKSLCDRKNMNILVGRLEEIYTQDELTGLLNRQGFKLMSVPAFDRAIEQNRSVCAFMFDLDCLKLINDTFGHAEGNFAIQVLAHALESSTAEKDICSRPGGDEFQVLAFDYTVQKADELIYNVNQYLDNYNKLHTKDYRIQASCGYCLKVPDTPADLEEMYKEADLKMYEHKRNKDKQILKGKS